MNRLRLATWAAVAGLGLLSGCHSSRDACCNGNGNSGVFSRFGIGTGHGAPVITEGQVIGTPVSTMPFTSGLPVATTVPLSGPTLAPSGECCSSNGGISSGVGVGMLEGPSLGVPPAMTGPVMSGPIVSGPFLTSPPPGATLVPGGQTIAPPLAPNVMPPRVGPMPTEGIPPLTAPPPGTGNATERPAPPSTGVSRRK